MEEITNCLEKYQILDFKNSYEIINDLRSHRSDENKDQLEFEMIILNTRIENGRYKVSSIGVDESGKEIFYPQINEKELFSEYIEKRYNESSNPYLKAKYATFLLEFKKHNKYAQYAITNFLLSEEEFEKKDSENVKLGLLALQCIINAFYISKKSKQMVEEVKTRLVSMIINYKNTSSSYFIIRADLLDIIIKNRKVFIKDDINKELLVFLKSFSLILQKDKRYHNMISIYEKCKLLAEMIEDTETNWFELIGNSYELIISDMGESFATLSFCRNAIDAFKNAGNQEKEKEYEIKYETISANMEFKKFEIPFDYEGIIENAEVISNEVIKLPSDQIIYGLTFDKSLLPKYENILKASEKTYEQSVIQHLANTAIFDQRGNQVEIVSTEEEYRNYFLYQDYEIQLKFNLLILNKIFTKSIKFGKLSYEIVMDHFRTNTWLGIDQSIKLGTGEIYTYNWLRQIGEPLRYFFDQMNRYYDSKERIFPNFTLMVDCLGSKIEGLFRDLITILGYPTVLHTSDNSQRQISREKDLNQLIREDFIQNIFDDDELLFFKYFLTNQKGYNLRNRLAHTLLYPDEYNFEIAILIIMALFRIGKYTISDKTA